MKAYKMTVSELLDAKESREFVSEHSTALERAWDALADLAREAVNEATPETAMSYAVAIGAIRNGLECIVRIRGE